MAVRRSPLIRALSWMLLLGSVGLANGAQNDSDARVTVTVGVVYDGADTAGGVLLLDRREAVHDAIAEEARKLTRRDFDLRFPADKQVVGDWTIEGARAAVDRLMADPQVDVVLSLGPFATDDLAARGPLPKPAIGAWALDRIAQQLPEVDDTTGVRNFNYVIAPGSSIRDLKKFREVVGISSAHVLLDSRFLEALPEVPRNTELLSAAAGLRLHVVPVGESAAEALDALPDDTQGVYITPLLRMPTSEFDRLVEGLTERKIPSFSLIGRDEVERGVLACVRTPSDLDRLARRIALNIQRILLGEDAGTLPITLETPERLVINMKTARAIRVFPRWRTLLEADLIQDLPIDSGPVLTFDAAVREAVERNLSLQARDREVTAGREEIARARSGLLPQLDAFSRWTRIDEDRAAASLGAQAERTGTAGISLSQLLYSEGTRTNLDISRYLQTQREWDREALRLDIALDAAVAYLDVLRAETLARVEQDNLRLTESNLDLARRRERVGASGPADVYRWESQLATGRISLIVADNRARSARVAMNRLLHRPLEAPFAIEAPGLTESWLITCGDRLDPYVNNPISYAVFRAFSVAEGLSNSVELRALDEAIAAQDRALSAARRSRWAPTVALQGNLDRDFSLGGAGASASPLLPVPKADRNDWSIALQASLPLFTGGSRRADVRQSTDDLAALGLQREALAEAIELRIRAALFEGGSSYASIELAEEAARAARDNLELVTDAYSRGVVPIIDLLDAQNASRTADQFASNAVYEFLADLMEAQRAGNNFDFFLSEEDRDRWFARLEAFYTASGAAAPRGEAR